jgi:hypothetical protein
MFGWLRFGFYVLGSLGVLALVGCDRGLQAELHQAKEKRWAEGRAKLEGAETARYQLFKDKLPATDAKPAEGSKIHPMLEWRLLAADRTTETTLKRLLDPTYVPKVRKPAEGEAAPTPRAEAENPSATEGFQMHYRGTPTEPAVLAGSSYLAKVADFWGTLKGQATFKDAKHGLHGYLRFIQSYKKAATVAAEAIKGSRLAEAPAGAPPAGAKKPAGPVIEMAEKDFIPHPFVVEGDFDTVFIHIARFLQNLTEGMDPNGRFHGAMPYWGIAFDFEPQGEERLAEYLLRLCRVSKLSDTCKEVADELRPLAVHGPYLEWLSKQVDGFLVSYQTGVFVEVMKQYQAVLAKESQEWKPELIEDPQLPSTYENAPVPTALQLLISPEFGVIFAKDLKLAETWSGGVPADLPSKVDEKLKAMQAAGEALLDLVVVTAPGALTGKDLVAIGKAFPRTVVTKLALVGRRRVDYSNVRVATLLRVYESDTMSYALTEGAPKIPCYFMGVAGKSAGGQTGPGSYLVWTKQGVKALKLEEKLVGEGAAAKPETVIAAQTLDTRPDDWAGILAWLDANLGKVRLYISDDHTYDQMLVIMSRLLMKCTDTQLPLDERATKLATFECGKADPRPVTLAWGICDAATAP